MLFILKSLCYNSIPKKIEKHSLYYMDPNKLRLKLRNKWKRNEKIFAELEI